MTSTTHVLRAILLEGHARTQSDIQQEMEKRGEPSSQSKVSRLLHQIGAVKIIDNEGKTQYRLPHEVGLLHEIASQQDKTPIRQWVLDVIANETLIILHTTPGAAGMVARIIDQHRMKLDVLGTIAGDDTIFIAPKETALITTTTCKIMALFDI
jgi:transcriptional regulator of arginine metabolism